MHKRWRDQQDVEGTKDGEEQNVEGWFYVGDPIVCYGGDPLFFMEGTWFGEGLTCGMEGDPQGRGPLLWEKSGAKIVLTDYMDIEFLTPKKIMC